LPNNGQRLGYVRVSSTDQNPERQLVGQEIDKTFADTVSGKTTHRPQLAALREFAREGDHVLVHSMDRLARNLDDLRALVQEFTTRGIRVTFVKEGLTFDGQDTPLSTLLLSVMGAFAEFERALILERQAEGIAAAKARGVYRGRAPALTQERATAMVERVRQGESVAKLAREFGVSRQTVYSYAQRA
jgi:DNA invertase Pin-like site-specific DNA recombinase